MDGPTGYIADVTYEGVATNPEATPAYTPRAVYKAAPVAAYAPKPVISYAPAPAYAPVRRYGAGQPFTAFSG